MQAKCDALINKYKQVAEEATRRAKAEREEMQLEALERYLVGLGAAAGLGGLETECVFLSSNQRSR